MNASKGESVTLARKGLLQSRTTQNQWQVQSQIADLDQIHNLHLQLQRKTFSDQYQRASSYSDCECAF